MVSIACIRPSLNRTVDSAGDPGGELAIAVSSWRRYLIGENAFLGLDGEGEEGCSIAGGGTFAVSIVVFCATVRTDVAEGDLGASVDKAKSGFCEKLSLVGEDREFCLAGDSADSGSGMLAVSRSVC